MLRKLTKTMFAFAAVTAMASGVLAEDLTSSLKVGAPDIKSAGPLAFGPDGVLFVGDTQGAAIFAIATGDTKPAGNGELKVEAIDEKIAAMLGTTTKEMAINDMIVNPASGQVYLSVSRGTGPTAAPVILRVDRNGKISEVPLKDVKFAKASIANPATRNRVDAITDLAYIDGRVFVAGLSNEEFASKLRSLPFPFSDKEQGTSIEIFHGAHGKFETHSPIRTFAYFKSPSEECLLAAYTCTPLVKIPLKDLAPGAHVKGTTVAELGNRNKPLDMVVYEKGGKNYILMANNSRGLMKITADGIEKAQGITSRIADKAGQSYETLDQFKNNVVQLDRLDKEHAVILVRGESGALNLETIPLP